MKDKLSMGFSKKSRQKFAKMLEKLKKKHGQVAIVLLRSFAKELAKNKTKVRLKKLYNLTCSWLCEWKKAFKESHNPEDLLTWTRNISQELARRSFSALEVVSGKITENSTEKIARLINATIAPHMEDLERKIKR